MHIMLKWASIFLTCAIATGLLSLSGIMPEFAKLLQNLCLISIVLIMFSGIAYSLRGEDPRA